MSLVKSRQNRTVLVYLCVNDGELSSSSRWNGSVLHEDVSLRKSSFELLSFFWFASFLKMLNVSMVERSFDSTRGEFDEVH